MNRPRPTRSAAPRAALTALLLLFAALAAALDPFEFRDAEEEARFRALAHELRCVMCQNQSLADSNAQIARDLREQVLELMRQGLSDPEIKTYLVERYSEFVLYRTPVTPATWLLWFGPAVVLLIGAGVVTAIVRRRARSLNARRDGAEAPDPDQEW